MKHLLLSAFLLLFASNLTAQLHVSPSATADSYIYANDVVIYVENDIHLVLNNVNPETQASIYLRGDSQLIQGDKTTSTNYGDGHLSVWQEGRTNNFGYHNWSTPVGNPQLSNTGNTNFGIQSFYDVQLINSEPHPTHSEKQISTGSVNGLRDPLKISNRWIYVLRGQGNYAGWVYVGNSDGIFPGDGYTMKGTIGTTADNPQRYDFRGRPNDGIINKGAVPSNQFVYLGNPYPSHIDMRDFLIQNLGIEGTVWYYEKSEAVLSHNLTQIQSGYGTWVIADGVSIDNRYGGGGSGTWVSPTYVMYNADGTPTGGPTHGTGTLAEARFAQIGQGFMVRGNGNTNPVEFNNSMRRYIPADYFNNFKNAAESPSTFQATFASAFTQPGPDADFYTVDATLRFHIEINESYTRDMVLMLSDNSTKGEDRGFDGRHPSVISVGDAYWKIEDTPQPFVIQTRPFDYMELIPLGLRMRNGSTSFKIKLAEMKGFDNLSEAHGSEIRIYLFDQINNQYQRIGLEHTATINHNGNAGNIEDRYFIVYRRGINQDIATLKNSLTNVNFFQNNPKSKLEVSNPDLLDIKNAAIYDMRGRQVLNENNIGKVSSFSFPTHNLSSGVYIVKLTTTDNAILDYKITVHNR